MAAKGYTTEVLVEAEIQQDITTSTDPSTAEVAQWIEEEENEIDELTESSFSAVTSTDIIIPYTQENVFTSPIETAFNSNVRADTKFNTYNSFFLQDANGVKRSPILCVCNLCANQSSSFGTESDSFTALTQNTGSGGDFVVDLGTGRIEILKCAPIIGHPRGIKTTFIYGFSSTVPVFIQKLATKKVARRIIASKLNKTDFSSPDSITIDTLSVIKNTAQMVAKLKSLDEEIRELEERIIGTFITEVVI